MPCACPAWSLEGWPGSCHVAFLKLALPEEFLGRFSTFSQRYLDYESSLYIVCLEKKNILWKNILWGHPAPLRGYDLIAFCYWVGGGRFPRARLTCAHPGIQTDLGVSLWPPAFGSSWEITQSKRRESGQAQSGPKPMTPLGRGEALVTQDSVHATHCSWLSPHGLMCLRKRIRTLKSD